MLHIEAMVAAAESKTKYEEFFQKLAYSPARALLVDYDGTLAPFRIERDRAAPYPAVSALLERIRSRTDTRVVIVTGRRASEVATLLKVKRIEIWGCHGFERLRLDGTCEMPRLSERTLRAMAEADELLMREGLSDLLEFKPAGTAVHWRGLHAAAADISSKVHRVWSMLPDREGLRLAKFNGGLEIRLAGRNKGDAVRTILSEARSNAAVAYLGDDETDEDAFQALKGCGLTGLVAAKYRPTAADVWIRPPKGLVAFFVDWIEACGGTS